MQVGRWTRTILLCQDLLVLTVKRERTEFGENLIKRNVHVRVAPAFVSIRWKKRRGENHCEKRSRYLLREIFSPTRWKHFN